MAKFSAHTLVTERILGLMKQHGAKWSKPFDGIAGVPTSVASGKPYRGINPLLLWGAPHVDQRWGTFLGWKKHAEAQGLREEGDTSPDAPGVVRKGEKSSQIVVWKMMKDKRDKTGETQFPFLRYYNVFNAEQVHGIEAQGQDDRPEDDTEHVDYAETFLSALGAEVKHTDVGRAYYRRTADYIHMPNREWFKGTNGSSATETYYSTLAHEHVHWTGSSDRLDRSMGGIFGGSDYAFEELIAEIGSAYLCCKFGISNEPTQDNAEYLNNWIRALEDDERAIMRAATQAKNAVTFCENIAEPTEEGA